MRAAGGECARRDDDAGRRGWIGEAGVDGRRGVDHGSGIPSRRQRGDGGDDGCEIDT